MTINEKVEVELAVLMRVLENINKYQDADMIRVSVEGMIEGNQNFLKWCEQQPGNKE